MHSAKVKDGLKSTTPASLEPLEDGANGKTADMTTSQTTQSPKWSESEGGKDYIHGTLFDLLAAITMEFPAGVVGVDTQGVIRLLNLAAGAQLRTNRLYALGRQIEEVLPKHGFEQLMELDKSAIVRTIKIEGKGVKGVAVPLIHKGEVFGAVEVWQDYQEVVELHEQLGRLTEKNLLLEEIVDQSFEEFVTVDEEGRVVYMSEPTARKIGVNKNGAQGADFFSIAEGEGMGSKSPWLESLLTMDKNAALEILPSLGGCYKVIGLCRSIYGKDNTCATVQRAQEGQSPLPDELPPKKKIPKKRPMMGLKRVTGTKYSFDDIAGYHPAIAEAKRIAQMAAIGDSTVLIKGESGTGKELFSHAIHNASSRSEAPFVKVNCAGIPETLLESELFGYSEGAFTGARKGGKPGRFELAHGGTIFLDEVFDLSMAMQSKLLRTLQEGEIERVGSTNVREVDVRVIATSKFDLMDKISIGEFREDLYFRLDVVSLQIPPLRDRLDDIGQLANHLLRSSMAAKFHNKVFTIDNEVLDFFHAYDWPGNIRELENVLEGACNFATGSIITMDCLPEKIRGGAAKSPDSSEHRKVHPLRRPVGKAELLDALEQTGGNKRQAAKRLDISRATLYNKIKEFQLEL